MFEKKSLVFYYCTTPLHMGAGSSIGAIDNPIQREVHSNHPVINGAGIKGAIRHHLNRYWGEKGQTTITELFGPETDNGDLHAGALSFTDACLVAFPVRSLKKTFAYVTCPYALARLKRAAENAGESVNWNIPAVSQQGLAISASNELLIDNKVYLETYEFKIEQKDIKNIASWLSKNCFQSSAATSSLEFFQKKLETDFVVLHDTDFEYFVKHCTIVEPHVRIDDETGAAADGALFYTENLPPESILAGLSLASIERTKGKDLAARRSASKALKTIFYGEGELMGINGTLIQMGGDSTTGRGLVLVEATSSFAEKEN